MVLGYYRTFMGRAMFEDEEERRSRLRAILGYAAFSGYRGRVSFRWESVHGRPKVLVEVRVYPSRPGCSP